MDTAAARSVVIEALRLELGRDPSLREVYAVQAVARQETGYGAGWSSPPHGPEAPQSRNWGAIQAPGAAPFIWLETTERPEGPAPPSASPTAYFYALDYSPNHTRPDGGMGSWFHGPYRVYPSDVEGARDVVRHLRRRGALEAAEREGTVEAVSAAMYGYYEGTTADREQAIAAHAQKLWEHVLAIAEQLGETPPLAPPVTAPVSAEEPGHSVLDADVPTLLLVGLAIAVVGGKQLWRLFRL